MTNPTSTSSTNNNIGASCHPEQPSLTQLLAHEGSSYQGPRPRPPSFLFSAPRLEINGAPIAAPIRTRLHDVLTDALRILDDAFDEEEF